MKIASVLNILNARLKRQPLARQSFPCHNLNQYMSMFTTTETKVRTKPTIEIPASDHDSYLRLAEIERKTIDQVMSDRLTDCALHNAVKGIWFGDKDRESLEEALGTNVSNASDIIGAARKNVRVRVGNVNVPIKPQLLERLKTRCYGQEFDKWLAALVNEHLEQYANMR